jgi:hypothetical protein
MSIVSKFFLAFHCFVDKLDSVHKYYLGPSPIVCPTTNHGVLLDDGCADAVDILCPLMLRQMWSLLFLSPVQITCVWNWKHVNSGAVVRYIPWAVRTPWGRIFHMK